MFTSTLISVILAASLLMPVTGNAAPAPCVPVVKWSEVPASVKASLKHEIGSIAPQGARFNATDVISDGLPRSRFFGACHQGKNWTLALERGGRGYHLAIFSYVDGKLVQQWSRGVPQHGFTTDVLVAPDAR